ncbi:NUDIX hydrolase domain-like protein [Amylocystis lapponica]|nr:NUDIX hydrolase domain-like protein [Amylocystis lapponica]
MPETGPKTYLDIVCACDNFRLGTSDETLIPWRLTPDASSPALGLLRPAIVAQLITDNERLTSTTRPNWCIRKELVSFAEWITTPLQRTRLMKETCERWRDAGLWPDVIGPRKWRCELYPVFRRPFGVRDAPADDSECAGTDVDAEGDTTNYAFKMERAACALFGAVTYGVHMSIYAADGAPDGSGACSFWVPTRARSKQTWPLFLDNSVAGGIPSGMGALECLVKEAMEEASIAEGVVRKHARAAGSVSYFFRTSDGWLQPEIEYVYDLRIPHGEDPAPFQPKPLDGEVEFFEFLPLTEVVTRMRAGLFKSNCALVLMDFMIRHGYITPDNEPEYSEIITRLHGRFEYEQW